MRLRQSRLRAFLLAAIVAAGVGLCARADVVSNCFRVVNYSVCWHVECTLDGFTDALDIVIDDNARNGFRAGDHGSRAYTYIAAVDSADTIDAGTFIWTAGMVEFADQSDFIVAFAIGCTESNRIDGNFGWVRLAYEGGAIVLKGGTGWTQRVSTTGTITRTFQAIPKERPLANLRTPFPKRTLRQIGSFDWNLSTGKHS